ncbi:MAG: NUDIX domain-containing protein [Anaerolineae bacterium]|nr:NUDIX domain-containing protein [Anaerolineae bacterium]
MSGSGIVEKVTAFITRGQELLVFEHPNAGVQIPAGTVEVGEAPEAAALREAGEETGLASLSIRRYLGCAERTLTGEWRLIGAPTRVYARPDLASFDWAYIRRGIWVKRLREAGEFAQIKYEEFDRVPDSQYVTMCILGWVPQAVLCDTLRRHFFHLAFEGRTEASWTVEVDNHTFRLFWAPLADLPEIVSPQDEWLGFLCKEFLPSIKS